MNVLVTGGAGYIGSHVVNVLKKEQGFTMKIFPIGIKFTASIY